jgi:L-ascorbate metabolism protein UlaG (beta-lactamase superfamily)
VETHRHARRAKRGALSDMLTGQARTSGATGGGLWLALRHQLFAGPSYRGPASDHFDGRRFHNLDRTDHSDPWAFLRWQWERLRRGAGPWPRWIDFPPGPPPPQRVPGAGLRVTFVGHSTVLLQSAGVNVLTDPVWSLRASPVAWAGPRRHRPPGLRFEDLPPIDVVLLSHNHYDHLDLPTLRRLAREHASRFVAGLGNGRLLAAAGVGPAIELDWWQQAPAAGELTVTCVPARHFSGRGLRDRDRSLWCGFVLPFPGGTVYFAGDTGFGCHFEEIVRRYGAPRLALLPIGAYLPRWFMGPVHLSPADALRAHRILGAQLSVALHFGTFRIADDAEGQAVAELQEEGAEQASFWVPGFGEGRDVP